MAVNKGGKWWSGSEASDLDEYLSAFSAASYPVDAIRHVRCDCGGLEFGVRVDETEGCAERTCASCGTSVLMLDSADAVEDAELREAACPCGNQSFNVAAGFALREAGDDVRWVYVGLRCVRDGVLGCYADWKIDYSPSRHLLDSV